MLTLSNCYCLLIAADIMLDLHYVLHNYYFIRLPNNYDSIKYQLHDKKNNTQLAITLSLEHTVDIVIPRPAQIYVWR